ncbi:MAG TPA: hypothetical protein PLA50_00260 [Bacteroidia bacterium]|nr:hypothetical protein [Bacteroidia bacterium]
MSLALAMSLGIAAAIVGLMQQQVTFTNVLSKFQFLRDDAPQINLLLSNLVNKADSYRIYKTRSNAVNLSSAVQTGGSAVRLRFRNPDGSASHAIIVFETLSGKKQLNFYYRPNETAAWPSQPSWTISSKPSLVDFSNDTGILLIKMTGPNDEEITYAGNPS